MQENVRREELMRVTNPGKGVWVNYIGFFLQNTCDGK